MPVQKSEYWNKESSASVLMLEQAVAVATWPTVTPA